MTELQSLRLSTGVDLDVAISGDPGHPPVILLHGFPESHRTWRHIAPDLARDHYVIAPDQRGYARSSKPEASPITPPTRSSPTCSRSPISSRSTASRWSGMTGAARSPGWPRSSIPTGSNGW